MQITNNPAPADWQYLVRRPYKNKDDIRVAVADIIKEVRSGGDSALRGFTKKFDGADLDAIEITDAEIAVALTAVPAELQAAIRQAKQHIEIFHRSQIVQEPAIETAGGIRCWRRSTAIERVGLYIPGGSAPLLSTVLMLGIPARLAGCREIILCTPCANNCVVHPAIIFAAHELGITRIFKIGGAQAIAAMAYGTESVPSVYKIFGPGNQYVTAAKQQIQMDGIAIDMPAGPSELCVLADDTAVPAFVAADLLSQAEHGADSQVVLVTTAEKKAREILSEMQEQLASLERRSIAEEALRSGRVVVMETMERAIQFVNSYAPEHLIIACADADSVGARIVNAGSVFIGNFSPESAGDYASGTNHTLPTNGAARAYSGVSVDSFVKKITFQHLTPQGLNAIAGTVIVMAEAEGLQAHANAVRVRSEAMSNINSNVKHN